MKNGANAESLRDIKRGLIEDLSWLEELDHPVVVELFTSTDCPGCTLADSVLFKIRDHEKVIALGCHVDYLGAVAGVDDPGTEECTNRQWYYSESRWTGETDLVTPQFITNGTIKFRALYAYEIFSKIKITYEKHRPPQWIYFEQPDEYTLRLYLPNGDHLLNHRDKPHGVWLIRYWNSEITKIPPAEEGGTPRVMRYTNTVKKIHHAGRWYGEPRVLEVDLTQFDQDLLKEEGGWVALIQYMNGDEIVAAGKLPDEKKDERAAE